MTDRRAAERLAKARQNEHPDALSRRKAELESRVEDRTVRQVDGLIVAVDAVCEDAFCLYSRLPESREGVHREAVVDRLGTVFGLGLGRDEAEVRCSWPDGQCDVRDLSWVSMLRTSPSSNAGT